MTTTEIIYAIGLVIVSITLLVQIGFQKETERKLAETKHLSEAYDGVKVKSEEYLTRLKNARTQRNEAEDVILEIMREADKAIDIIAVFSDCRFTEQMKEESNKRRAGLLRAINAGQKHLGYPERKEPEANQVA